MHPMILLKHLDGELLPHWRAMRWLALVIQDITYACTVLTWLALLF